MRKTDVIQINIGGDFQLMMNSALRYALGRHTYMVKVTADYLSANLQLFSDHTLSIMSDDLEHYFAFTVPLGGEFDCDIRTWKKFRKAVHTELEKRKK